MQKNRQKKLPGVYIMKTIEVNETYKYEKDDFSYTFRIFSKTRTSYLIITDTFDLYKVSKTEMINNLKNNFICLYIKEPK